MKRDTKSFSAGIRFIPHQFQELEDLTLSRARQTEEALTKLDQALQGFDAKHASAVQDCKTGAVSEIEVLRTQMYTYSVGAKAEITEIVAAISSGQGAGFKGGFGG